MMPHSSRVRFPLLAVASLLAAGVSFGVIGPVAQAQGPQADADAMFRQLDMNKDGKLTKAEVGPSAKNMIDQIFRSAEKPDGGSLTRAEFQVVFDKFRAGNNGGGTPPRDPGPAPRDPNGPPPPRANDGGFPPILRLLDGNNDQRLTRAELNRLTQLFDRLDTNKDGALDVAEVQAAGAAEGGAAAGSESTPPGGGASTKPAPASTSPRSSTDRPSSGTSTPAAGRGDTNAARLAGVWKGWIVHGRGENPNAGEMEIELTVEGNRMTGREQGTRRGPAEGLGSGTFTMTGNGKTGNIDTDGTSGSQDGRHSMGIYELDGDTLKWCVTQRNRVRPTTMVTDRGNYLLILRKQPARN